MFKNPGRKTKIIAKAFFWFYAVLAALFAVSSAISAGVDLVVGVIICAILISFFTVFIWIASLSIYARGEVLEDLSAIKKNTEVIQKRLSVLEAKSCKEASSNNANIKICPACGAQNGKESAYCRLCGQPL